MISLNVFPGRKYRIRWIVILAGRRNLLSAIPIPLSSFAPSVIILFSRIYGIDIKTRKKYGSILYPPSFTFHYPFDSLSRQCSKLARCLKFMLIGFSLVIFFFPSFLILHSLRMFTNSLFQSGASALTK